MAAKFPSITYSNLTTHIANVISTLVCNIGNNYNNLPTYHTNRVYQRNRTLGVEDMVSGANVTMTWNVELDGNNMYYDRKIYDHSKSNVTTIKQELDDTTAYIDIPKEILDFYKKLSYLPINCIALPASKSIH